MSASPVDRRVEPVGRPIADLLRASSVEVSSHQDIEALPGLFPSGTDVYLGYLPRDQFGTNVAVASRIRRCGFNPVPHIPVRHFADLGEIDQFLARLSGEAGVTRVLGIAGDLFAPRGVLGSTKQMIESDLLQKHGIAILDVAGHPEGSPYVADAGILAALADKLEAARARGLRVGLVSQFCFSAAPIALWLSELRKAGIEVPTRIGVAGPAQPASLVKFALRCGIGNSLSVLQRNTSRFSRLMRDATPNDVVLGLETALQGPSAANVAGFHFFPFGGLAKTSKWIAATVASLEAKARP